MGELQIGHFGLRTKDVDRAVEWYGKVFGAEIRFRNEFAVFMSFDDEHHRWSYGMTAKPRTSRLPPLASTISVSCAATLAHWQSNMSG